MKRALVASALAFGCGHGADLPPPPPPPALVPVVSASALAPANPPSLEEQLQSAADRAADPNMKSDALFRLAVLVSERERADPARSPLRLAQPISILRRIARENPTYPRMFHVRYQLGHDLLDAGRAIESSQVWRSLVCSNLYAFPAAAPTDATRDAIVPLAQEQGKRFQDPYPDTCTALIGGAEAASLVGEIWLRIGNAHFEQIDPADAVYGWNRAAVALRKAITSNGSHGEVQAQARYKLAWTYFKQQRYEAAVGAFEDVLRANAGEDYAHEATTYIAGSLTEVDFVGPREDQPFAVRPDVLDTEKDPDKAEAKMAVGLSRVQDKKVVPQGEPWTSAVYLALGAEYRDLNQPRSSAAAYALFVRKWPTDPRALGAQFQEALCWEKLTVLHPKRTEYRAKAANAFAEVVRQGIVTGAWRAANGTNDAVVRDAEALIAAAEKHKSLLP